MHRLFRHFIAALCCITIFSATGTVDGFLRVLTTNPQANPGASLVLTGFLNFLLVSAICLVVLAPVTSIADYLFTKKWPVPVYVQLPSLVPLLIVYLLPWWFILPCRVAFVVGALILMPPLLVYWGVFKGTDIEMFSDR